MPGALTQHRGTALTELENVGGAGLMWCVAGEGQPLETRCKQRETTKKKLMWLGRGQWGPKAGTTQQRAPEYLEKMLARRKKTKKI